MPEDARVFLVQSYPSIKSGTPDVSTAMRNIPPLGMLSIAAYLEERGVGVKVYDFNAKPEAVADFRKALRRERPEFLGVSCVTASFNNAVRLAEAAKDIVPDIKVVLGGPHVSALKQKIPEGYPVIDACVVGEGEDVFYQLVSNGLEKAPEMAGVVCRDSAGEIRFNGYPDRLLELDSLPYPAYHKLAGFPRDYSLPLFRYPSVPNTSIISSRGCPYACSYCDHSVFLRTFRYNSADYLYEHIRFLRQRYGIRHLSFYDDQFTFNRERVAELCHKLIYDSERTTFNCTLRAEHVDDKLLALLKRAGCWMISLGIESGDPEILARHRSSSDVGMLAECIRRIRRHGIRVMGLLMIGLPGETEESVQKSMDFVFSLPINDFNLAKFTPFPGSPIYKNAHDLGEFDEDWDKMDCMNIQFVPDGMTREEMEYLFWTFYRKHFSRPKVWADYMTMIWKSPDSWKRFGKNMGRMLSFMRSGSYRRSITRCANRSKSDVAR